MPPVTQMAGTVQAFASPKEDVARAGSSKGRCPASEAAKTQQVLRSKVQDMGKWAYQLKSCMLSCLKTRGNAKQRPTEEETPDRSELRNNEALEHPSGRICFHRTQAYPVRAAQTLQTTRTCQWRHPPFRHSLSSSPRAAHLTSPSSSCLLVACTHTDCQTEHSMPQPTALSLCLRPAHTLQAHPQDV